MFKSEGNRFNSEVNVFGFVLKRLTSKENPLTFVLNRLPSEMNLFSLEMKRLPPAVKSLPPALKKSRWDLSRFNRELNSLPLQAGRKCPSGRLYC
ncbi:MAG: hypothetical protein JSR83_01375 [Proteobacteria bacterium]|nr:hypothetical protein [Pseudomonadota bacterium]